MESVRQGAGVVERGRQHRAISVIWLAMALVVGGSWTVWAATTQTNSTSLTLNIGEAIEVVSWPDASLNLDSSAVPGEEVVSGPLRFTVKCNSEWGIEVKSDEPTGRLQEFDPDTSAYVTDGRTSQNAVEWGSTPSGEWGVLQGTGVNIATNQLPTGESGKAITFFLRYCPGFNDIRLTEGHVYRTVLTYTATVGY
jgi:hypothetical protein